MQTITLSFPKQKIAEFDAEDVEFTRQDGGLLLTANGEMIFQDTPHLETLINEKPNCHIAIDKGNESVLSQEMHVTVFTFEQEQIALLLK